MGRRGPRPKPKSLEELEANPGHRASKARKQAPLTPISSMPKTFDKAAREEWERLRSELEPLGLFTVTNQGTLECVCWAFSAFAAAVQEVKEFKAFVAARTAQSTLIAQPKGASEEYTPEERKKLRDLEDLRQRRSNAYMRYADAPRRWIEQARLDPGRKPKKDSFFDGH